MLYFLSKIIISAILIAAISEISKRSTFLGALLTSLPLISLFAIIWLYIDTNNPETIANLSYDIFWLVLPSLIFFLALPFFIHRQFNFYSALTFSLVIMISCYFLMIFILKKLGIKP